MTPAVDLQQLSRRESEQTEWKEEVADVDDVVETLSAFANDLANLGGGYVVCGAREEKDEHGFPRLVRTGLTASRLREVEGTVLTRCRERVSPPMTPRVEELPSEATDRRILVFIQPATGQAHAFRRGTQGARHFVRVSRTTIEARNGILRDLLVRKGVVEPWDRRPCNAATVNDLDLLALRDTLQRLGEVWADRGVEPYLSEEVQLSPFVPPLCVREPLTGVLRPRNFAVLLFGRETQRFVPGAFSLFSVYPGLDRSDPRAERHELAGTLLEQARRLTELLDAQTYTVFDKSAPTSPNAVKYPKRALYEAMGNVLAHRDYELVDPTRITAFGDRIEFHSPGSLPLGVDPIAFREGRSGPKWRNQALAWFFNRLQLAQAEGQGIPTILRAMREEGCPPPILDADGTRVLCVLPAHARHAGDRALLMELDAPVTLPTERAFTQIVRVPEVGEGLTGAALRAVPSNPDAWAALVRALDRGVERARDGLRGNLHVFAMAPYAAAALLGRRLDALARTTPVFIHQFDAKTNEWLLFSAPEKQVPVPQVINVYEEVQEDLGTGPDVIVAMEGQRPIQQDALLRLARQIGAGQIVHLRPRTAAPIATLGEAKGAITAVRQVLEKLQYEQPAASLHIVSTAPVSLLIEVGRAVSPTVYRSVVVYHYDPRAVGYFPVLDVLAKT